MFFKKKLNQRLVDKKQKMRQDLPPHFLFDEDFLWVTLIDFLKFKGTDLGLKSKMTPMKWNPQIYHSTYQTVVQATPWPVVSSLINCLCSVQLRLQNPFLTLVSEPHHPASLLQAPQDTLHCQHTLIWTGSHLQLLIHESHLLLTASQDKHQGEPLQHLPAKFI